MERGRRKNQVFFIYKVFGIKLIKETFFKMIYFLKVCIQIKC